MQSLTPNPVVRETVHKKLSAVKNIVEQANPKWQLLVTDGFRYLATQTRKFNAQVERFVVHLFPLVNMLAVAAIHLAVSEKQNRHGENAGGFSCI